MRSDIYNENSNALMQSNDKFDTFVKHGRVCNVELANSLAAGDLSVSWKQPANSIITNCYIVCTDAVAVASGDIGYDVGTSAHGEQLIAAQSDEILDGGTAVAIDAMTASGEPTSGSSIRITSILNCSASDNIDVRLYHNQGGNQDADNDPDFTYFTGCKL